MNECRWDDRLQDLFDGVLPPDEEEAVALHLHGCDACGAAWDGMTALRAAAADLPSGLAPDHDLWPGIADRLEAADAKSRDDGRRRPRLDLGRLGWAAAAAAALIVLMAGPLWREDPASGPYAELAAGYDTVRGDCRDGLASRGDEMPDETRTAVDEGLSLIDQAIRETQHALDKASAAPEQAGRLVAGYHRKLDLLENLARLANR